ncbi:MULTISPECIES: DUF927 domain-containing protein [Bacillus]|uniref:Uncharacterized protein n=1 Tax=Bacillus cereus TaxID=1396 RepID=A0A150AXF3_BACCE|nr:MULTISPECIES: DUF927 domain-containing protein [Bacillus]KXX88344.1 hypothetical protein AT274_09675 [Bacillus cereus]MCG3790962.1 DUF927 domain-containing protein [Bacillus sp. UTDS19-33BHI26]RSC62959.1 DUF927 domain-containing protein [Bacillus sp. (in: firmicutes)]HDX9541499.1 DUF927 domain-containing protein [Bacillus thuringiensis]
MIDHFNNIPTELKSTPNWVLWRAEVRNGKSTKVPFRINGTMAQSNNRNTWSTFEEVLEEYQQGDYSGIGFMFSKEDAFIGIDIDHCVQEGEFTDLAKDIMTIVPSYTEYSPSGQGIHIIAKGKLPLRGPGTGKKNPALGLEIYRHGRYFTFTGNIINKSPVEESTEKLKVLFRKYIEKKEAPAVTKTTSVSRGSNISNLSNSEIWERMFNSKNGRAIRDLFCGMLINSDHSSTDMALANHLAFWANKDAAKMDSMFRESALMRDKWDKPHSSDGRTYGEMTIDRAISSTHNSIFDYEADKNDKEDEQSILPSPYKSINGALYRVEIKVKKDEIEEQNIPVARQVPYLKRELCNIEKPQVYYELTWNNRGNNITELVTAGSLATKREMMPLAEKSFPVNDNNVKQLIDYFDKVLASNEIETGWMVERLGHIKNDCIHPLITKGYDILPADLGDRQLLEAFQVEGTIKGWIEGVFNKIKAHPRALFFVLASFASIFLHDLKIDPFIVELAGSTSTGKTTAMKVAASVWGTNQLINEFNSTKTSVERKSSFLNSFPLYLDDSRKADERLLQSFVYHFSGGRSKGRGTLNGSQLEYTWKNICLATGEISLNDYSTKAGGVAARVISLTDSPFTEVGHLFFEDLYKSMENNYGLVGVEFFRQYQEKKEIWLPQFYKFKDLYMKKSQGNEVLTRLALYYSVVHFTGSIVKEIFNLDLDLNNIYSLFDEMADDNKAIDKPKQFLEEILNDLDSNRQTIFYDNHFTPNSIHALYKNKADCLYLTPAYLSKMLGPEEKTIRKEWLKKGMTIASEKKGSHVDYKAVKHEGKTYRVIPLNMDFVNSLGFDFKYINEPKYKVV